MYMMGIFLLQDRVHKQMDTIRSQFFLERGQQQIQISYGEMGKHLPTKTLWGIGNFVYKKNERSSINQMGVEDSKQQEGWYILSAT